VFIAAIVKSFQISEHTSVFIIGSPIAFDFYLSLLRRLSQVNQYHFLVANEKPTFNKCCIYWSVYDYPELVSEIRKSMNCLNLSE